MGLDFKKLSKFAFSKAVLSFFNMKLQYSFLPPLSREFGGSLAKGKRKLARPLKTKSPIHLVLKSNRHDLITYRTHIAARLIRDTQKNAVRIHHHAVNFNHMHLLISFKQREAYKKFIRAFTAAIANLVGKGMWSFLPYTRIATWGREFRFLLNYVSLNRLEAEGLSIRYQVGRSFDLKRSREKPR